jgi:hypothetical protein
MFGLSTGLFLSSSNFPITSKLSYYFYIINKYVRYNNLHSFYGGTPGEVQDRIICNTREYDLNRIGWCLRFSDLAPFTVFDYFSHPFYRVNISFL